MLTGNYQHHRYARKGPSWFSYIVFVGLVFFVTAAFVWIWALKDFAKHDIAAVIRKKTESMQVASQVRDRHGVEIGVFSDETRYPVRLSEIPTVVQRAFIAAEDDRFFSHMGVSPTGILRAAIANIKRDRFAQGGSTITQQLVRQFLLPKEKTVARKLKEVVLALTLERQMSKKEIFEKWLNSVYLGNNAWGVEAAARHYFEKPVAKLTLSEAALIAGLPQAPTRYAPHLRPKLAKQRQEYVLGQLRKKLLISGEEYLHAYAQPLNIRSKRVQIVDRAPWVTEAVRLDLWRRLEQKNLPESGLEVKTTIDWQLQKDLQKEIKKHLSDIRSHGMELSVVVLDATNGEILALVGGSDFAKNQFNRAVDLYRPFGAAIYPMIFGWAIEKGFTKVDGYYSLAEAAVKSRFAEAEQLAPDIGYGTVRDKLTGLGFVVKDAMAIDELHGSPLSLARAYLGVSGLQEVNDRGLISSVMAGKKSLYLAGAGSDKSYARFDPSTAWVLRQWLALNSHVDSQLLAGQPLLKSIKEWNEWWLMPRSDVVITAWIGADGRKVKDPKALKNASRNMDQALGNWITNHLKSANAVGPRPDGVSYQLHSNGPGKPMVRLPFVTTSQGKY